MNPVVVRNQSLAAAALFAIALLLGGMPLIWVVLTLACVGWANFVALNICYAVQLGDRGRIDGRREGDRTVAVSGLIVFGSTTVVATIMLLLGVEGYGLLSRAHIPDVFVAIILFAWVTVPASSHWDWYFVRPRRDGLLRLPPCQDPDEDNRRRLTRVWLWHRSVSVAGFALGAVALLVLIFVGLAAVLPHDSYTEALLQTVALPLSIVAVALLPWIRGFITFVPMLGSTLSARLGDSISAVVDRRDRTGVVFSVALDHGYVAVSEDGAVFKVPLSDPTVQVFTSFPFPADRKCAAGLCQGFDDRRECSFGTRRRLPDGTFEPKETPSVGKRRFFVL
jgi:hypothetical protein